MRPLLPLLAAACLLAGCTHASVVATSGGATTTTVTTASVAVSGSGGAGGWVLLGIVLIAAEMVNPVRPLEPPPGPLDPGRRVNEVDCTKPIADRSANLKCK